MCVVASIRTYEFISFDKKRLQRKNESMRRKNEKKVILYQYKPVTIFQSEMCVPSMVKLYDDQIMPPTKFLFQFSCIDTGQERQGADHCTERVVGVIWGEKTNKKTVQPHSMAEQDINSNIKLNMIIKWLQREKKKKSA